MNKITAVIPVRKGSQRIKNKNFKKFCGKSLLEHKIIQLKKVKNINKIIVNTDSIIAIRLAKKYKVDYYKRDKYFASSSCPNNKFWSNIASTTNSKYILLTHCTSPMIKISTYENCIKTFFQKKKIDSLNTVSEVRDYLFLKKKPLNFNIKKAPNSQNLPTYLKYNSAVSIISTSKMKKNKTVFGNKPFFYKLDLIESHDINTTYDFELAKFLFKKY